MLQQERMQPTHSFVQPKRRTSHTIEGRAGILMKGGLRCQIDNSITCRDQIVDPDSFIETGKPRSVSRMMISPVNLNMRG